MLRIFCILILIYLVLSNLNKQKEDFTSVRYDPQYENPLTKEYDTFWPEDFRTPQQWKEASLRTDRKIASYMDQRNWHITSQTPDPLNPRYLEDLERFFWKHAKIPYTRFNEMYSGHQYTMLRG